MTHKNSHNFAQNWLNILCQSVDDLYSALFLLTDPEKNELIPAAQWPQNTREPLELVVVSKLAIKNQDYVVSSNVKTDISQLKTFDYLAAPIYVDKQLLGVIAVKTAHHDEVVQNKILHALNVGSTWLALPNSKDEQRQPFYMTVVKLAVNCLQQDSVLKIYTVLISELTHEFSCERVAIGEIKNHHTQIVAVSNSAKFDDKSNLLRSISAAMDEAVDQDQITIYPKAKNESTSITYAHAELARKFGSGAICTIPLVYNKSVFAVLTMERSEEKPFDQETINICEQTIALISPFLNLKQNDELFLVYKLGLSAKNYVSNLFGYHHLEFKLLALAMIILISFSALVDGDFRIQANAVLEGRIQRTISAPIEGFIKSANVRAGDTVLKGEIMATVEDADLKLEKIKLQGEQQQLQSEYQEAMANRDLVKVRVLNAQLAQVNAKIQLKQEQIQRTFIQTPFDGIIIEGDLSQSLGAPVDRGDILFKIAPLEGYRVILKVNERSISYIRHGQQGLLSLASLPKRKFPLQIEKIIQVANTDAGSNIFRVEAALPDTPKLLRPGMEGIAKIDIGQKKLLWIWTHEWVDWIKLWVWSWWP